MGQFRARHLRGLAALNAEVVATAIERLELRRLTIDGDGSVVSTGLTVAWAQRGYNLHRRKVPSYYPITAYEAQGGSSIAQQERREMKRHNVHNELTHHRAGRTAPRGVDREGPVGHPTEWCGDDDVGRTHIVPP